MKDMQQMIIDRKSWHYRYNIYVYGMEKMERLNNGCPYFWMTILSCYLSPIFGLYWVGERLTSGIQAPKISEKTAQKIAKIVIISLSLLGALFTGYGLGIGEWKNVMIIYGICGLMISSFFCIVRLVIAIHDWKDNRPKKEPKQPNMVIQMMKAKKSKYCPKLEYTN